jgi:uncharacterized protein DUF6152
MSAWTGSVSSKLWMALTLAAAANVTTYAHHFVVASYDLNKTVTVEGKVVQFLFRKPHTFIQVEVPDPVRQPQTLLAEWDDGSQLSRTGVFKDTLKSGDRVVVTGNPPRNPAEHKLRIVTIVRPSDGWRWSGK